MEELYEKLKDNNGKFAYFEYHIGRKINSIIGYIEILVSGSSTGKLFASNEDMWRKLEKERAKLFETINDKTYEHGEVLVAYELYDKVDLKKVMKSSEEQIELYNSIKDLLEKSVKYVRSIEGKQSIHKDILEKIKESAKEASELVNKFNEEDLNNISELKDDCVKKLNASKR